jgi:hypothetical protein
MLEDCVGDGTQLFQQQNNPQRDKKYCEYSPFMCLWRQISKSNRGHGDDCPINAVHVVPSCPRRHNTAIENVETQECLTNAPSIIPIKSPPTTMAHKGTNDKNIER